MASSSKPTNMNPAKPPKPKPAKMSPAEQLAAFQKAARELGTDDDPERFRDTIRKLAEAPPAKHADMPQRRG